LELCDAPSHQNNPLSTTSQVITTRVGHRACQSPAIARHREDTERIEKRFSRDRHDLRAQPGLLKDRHSAQAFGLRGLALLPRSKSHLRRFDFESFSIVVL
jgi:hypothetical protein